MKKSALLFTILTAFTLTACNSTQATTPSTTTSTVAPSSSVAEVKDDYVAIGGKTPYEKLTATEEANLKKAEAEAQKQAEEARLQAEAKKKAEAQKQAVQQQQASQTAEQPAPEAQQAVAQTGSKKFTTVTQEEALRHLEQIVADLEARGYYGKNKDDVPPEMKQQRSGVVAAE